MNSTIDRLKIFFLGLFAVACAASWIYQLFWIAPEKACESRGNWWEPKTRVCATPLYLPYLTGRPAGTLSPEALRTRAQRAQTDEAKVLGVTPSSAKPAAGTP